jgi:N6-adenosine-specific RNA methylase IME4
MMADNGYPQPTSPVVPASYWCFFRATATGMAVVGDPAYEDWEAAFNSLRKFGESIQWLLGDMLIIGQERYPDMYSQALDATDYEQNTLSAAVWVSSRVDNLRRRKLLSWSHHREVAALAPPLQDQLLAKAEVGHWTRSELREAVRAIKMPSPVAADEPAVVVPCTEADLAALGAGGQRFGTVYADPPWAYSNQGTRAATDNHYVTMTVDEIAALPVRDLAAPQGHLHMWTTNAFLFECPRILEAWGFDYKGVFVWVKPQIGLGNYWRVSHEFLVLGVRGGLTFDNHAARSWLEIDRGTHSAKPEQVRHLIETVSPGPRLELFGRAAAPGWTVWGNEVERDLFYNNGATQHG